MGGRGSSSGGSGGGGTHIETTGKQRRGPAGTRRQKIKTEPGNPIGTPLPLRPAGGAQGTEGQ